MRVETAPQTEQGALVARGRATRVICVSDLRQ
jgi:hypothetical protein